MRSRVIKGNCPILTPDIRVSKSKICIEVDSSHHHLGHAKLDDDRLRNRLLAEVGWTVVRLWLGRLEPVGEYDVAAESENATIADRHRWTHGAAVSFDPNIRPAILGVICAPLDGLRPSDIESRHSSYTFDSLIAFPAVMRITEMVEPRSAITTMPARGGADDMVRRRSAPTMNDVAALAGVSQATVSLVLNGADGGRFTRETKAKVERAVREIGYRTNAHAKVLREGVAGMIGFIGDSVATAPFSGMIIAGAQERAWEAGMLVLTVDTAGDRDIEDASIEAMLSYSVAGVVYAGMYNRRLLVPDILHGSRAVVLNSLDAAGVFPSVAPDEELGGYTATKVLLEAGHRRIGLINIETLESGLPAAVGRYHGYARALAEAGLDVDHRIIRFGQGSESHGYAHATDLLSLDNRPTAIFCVNDRTAWGAYQAAGDLGLKIPRDLSIVGFDNQDILAPNLRPGLTTLDLPFKAMGRRAVEILLEDAPLDGRVELFECPVIARGSVKELKETE